MSNIIVEFVGGLGNQLFQYAFYESLKNNNKDKKVYACLERFEEIKDNKGFQVSEYFSDAVVELYDGDVNKIMDRRKDLFNKIKVKAFGYKSSFIIESQETVDINYLNVNYDKDVYYRGLWQSEKYFNDIKDSVIEKLKFSEETIAANRLDKFPDKQYVSIHVRRGDYISNPVYSKLLGDVCSKLYYENAVEYFIRKFGKDVCFMVFSDDINWVEREFDFLKNKDVKFNRGKRDIDDLYLMSICDHNIIANSTFSWWGAYLNSSKNKIVISPGKWYGVENNFHNEIIPEDWIKL